MALRPFKLPNDFPVMIDLIEPSFQYPENEEWNVQQDEIESMVDTLNGVKRIWLLFRFIQLVSPPMRDVIRGFVWEEDGKPVGLSNITRMGATDQWMIGNVSVLPEYRRRGIARKLVEACVDFARERKARMVMLDVIAGNTPAYTLYTKLGFDHFSGFTQFDYDSNGTIADVPLPDGYTFEERPIKDWRTGYELARRVTPERVKQYSPVEEGRYRRPAVLNLLAPVVFAAMGSRPLSFVARHDGQVVASAGIQVRKRAGGINSMAITLDPGCPELAPFLVRKLAGELQRQSPGRRTEFSPKHWQPALIEAAAAAGFTSRADMHSLGMIV